MKGKYVKKKCEIKQEVLKVETNKMKNVKQKLRNK